MSEGSVVVEKIVRERVCLGKYLRAEREVVLLSTLNPGPFHLLASDLFSFLYHIHFGSLLLLVSIVFSISGQRFNYLSY